MNTEQDPKPLIANADPVLAWGRLPLRVKRAKEAARKFAGALVAACSQEEFWSNTGDPAQSEGASQHNRQPVTGRPGWAGSRRGPYYRGDRVMPEEGRGLGSRAEQEAAKARRLA